MARLLLAACLVAASAAALADATLEQAKRLLRERHPGQAYALLLPLEPRRAGDPEFDYLLGIAANDSGHAQRAVFALERVLAVQPDNPLARAEIARAYLALGERDTARREFRNVEKQPIPPQARAAIERFLAAISAAETTQVQGFVELGLGHDSNVNSATSAATVAIPSLGGLVATLSPSARRLSDSFYALTGGLTFTRKLSERWSLVGGAAADFKINRREDAFDTQTFDGNLAARWAQRDDALTFGTQLQEFDLDNRPFRDTAGLVGQWQHHLDERRQVTGFAQYARLSYPTQGIRDVDRTVLGAAYGQAFDARSSPVLFASAYAGREKERAEGVPHLGDDLWGVRLGGQLRPGEGWTLFGGVNYEQRRYGGPEPLFLVTRRDRQTDLRFGASYLLRAGTTLIAQATHTDNRSNVEIDRFRRTVAGVSVRFDF